MKPKSNTMSLFFAICLHLQLKSDTHDIIPWGRLKIFDFFSGEGSEIFNSLTIELNRYDHANNDNDNEDSDEEFTLKDVVGKENEQAVGSILGAASSADDDEDDEVIKSDEKCHVKG